ncbi:MAG: ABC transporter substrate-binding protein [Rectinemataceae bacterium]
MHRTPARLFKLWALLLLSAAAMSAQTGGQQALRSLALPRPAAFSIDYFQGYRLVTVKSAWPGSKDSYSYLLVDRGSAKPAATVFAKARRIETPVRRVISFSTSYLPAISAIGEAASIVGLDSAAYVYDPSIRARAAAKTLAELSPNGMPDLERIVALSPDAVFTYGVGSEWDTHPKLIEAGLPVILDGEWNEADPLARAEWAIFIAAFYNKEDAALAHYREVEKRYLDLKARAAAARTPAPKVLNNGPFQGTWYVSGGESFMARLLSDSGARYLWADSKGTGGLALTVEAAYQRALGATVWLNPAYGMRKITDVVALDTRFASLPVITSGNVWNNDRRVSEAGGNDYFESAVTRPDEVLRDLVAIFHPELLPNHSFTWYQKLDR